MLSSIIFGIIHLIAAIFKGRTGNIIEKLTPVARDVVGGLMDSDMSGPDKFEEAKKSILAAAVEQGLEAADHAIGLLIEMEVTRAKGDALEEILDNGLEAAREIISSINASDLTSSSARRAEAFSRLKVALIDKGKELFTKEHTLNLLIEAAVSSFKN